MQSFIRTIISSSILLFSSLLSFSQSDYTYNISVRGGNDQHPMANLDVVLIETNTFERKVFKTNANGQLSIHLTNGEQWVMNVGEMRSYTIIDIAPNSSGSGSAIIHYDPARWLRLNKTPVDRSSLVIEDIPQRLNYNTMPDPSNELLEVEVLSEKGRPYLGIPVKVTCFNTLTSYSAMTNEEGIARFLIPLNEQYQIDLDGEDNFEYHDTGNKPYRRKITLTYEKINFKEKLNTEGQIEQLFIEAPKPVSNRVLVTLRVAGGDRNGAGEPVYIQMDYSNKVYKGKTNDNGEVIFLLPKKNSYHVSFEYQKDAGVLDLSRFFGIGYITKGYVYEPDERLQYPERFLPTALDVKSYDINNFNKQIYPDTPTDELINVHAKWGNNKINSGSKEAILELGFSVKEPQNKTEISKPLNIAFVLDKSGSMGGEKMDILKAAMLELVKKLRPNDHVAIVLFDSEAVLAYGQEKADVKYMSDIIGAIQADGGTSIFEGLKLGYEEVKKHKKTNSVDRVILLTDGYGSKPVDFILEQSKAYFESGIAVSTIGVGQGYNSSLLSLLSKYSGGLEHQAIESEGITAALDAEFESMLYPLASNLKIKIKYNNKLIYKTLFGIPEVKNTDNSVHFSLDKVYSSLNKMALIKFKIENPTIDIAKDLIRIEISYFDEVKKAEIDIVKEMNLEWTDETDLELITTSNQKLCYSVATINQALKVIADHCDAKDYQAAKSIINETLSGLKKINSDKYATELIPLIDELKGYIVALDRAIKKGQ